MYMIDMESFGLNQELLAEAKQYTGLTVGRVISQQKFLYKVICENGVIKAEVSGKYRYEVRDLTDYPAVGDFVMLEGDLNPDGKAVIQALLSRKSVFIRQEAGTSQNKQVVATNIDMVFICMALNNDFNLRRLERYLSVAWDSRAIPVVVLTKADLCSDLPQKLMEVDSVAVGVDVLVTSSLSEDGYKQVIDYIKIGQTVAFIGSSGVGKSTLINRLLGQELFKTQEIRGDDKGRHTTTTRQLIQLPNGGMVVDTPGMRELQLDGADLTKAFLDIEELSKKCRFKDCSHQKEPGCAVQDAVSEGLLSLQRLESYFKLTKESRYDGLNSKQIEKVKLETILAPIGGIKNARKYFKTKKGARP